MKTNKVWAIQPVQLLAFVLLIVSQLMYSCTSRRVYRTVRAQPGPPSRPIVNDNPAHSTYKQVHLVSKGSFSALRMTKYFLSKNPKANPKSVDYIARVYISEASVEGINHDIAFAQMCHETNFLRYGNQVAKWQNNYCGLGATDDGSRGVSFPDVVTGVRVHIQHLKAYGSRYPLRNRLVDPRFKYVKRGSAPTIDHLAGTWASDLHYAKHLRKHLSGIAAY